jgi:hypothetical protein
MSLDIGQGFSISYEGQHVGDLVLRDVTGGDFRRASFFFRREGMPDVAFELGRGDGREIVPEQDPSYPAALSVEVERMTQTGPLSDARVKLDFQGNGLYRTQRKGYLPSS